MESSLNSFTIDFKTGIMAIGWVSSLVLVWAATKFKVKKIEDSTRNLNNVVFEKRGGLNLVSNKTCKERRKPIYDIIDREAGITSDAVDRIENLTENMYILMGSQGVKPKKFVKKDRKKTFYQCLE